MASAEVIHRYREFTAPSGEIDAYLLDVPLDGARPEVEIRAELRRPDLVRDGLLVLGEVLTSDLRRQASDRADYLAYLLRQGKRANQIKRNDQVGPKIGLGRGQVEPSEGIVATQFDHDDRRSVSREEFAHTAPPARRGLAADARIDWHE